MKDNFKTILIVASVALNLVFVGTYIAYKLPSLAAMHSSASPVYWQLGVTAEQRKQIEAEREKMQAGLHELSQEIQARQIELIGLLTQAVPAQNAIAAKQKEIQGLQASVQERIISHLLKVSEQLSPEQRTRFFQLVRDRIEMSAQACPGWMKPPGGCPRGAGCQ
jgi:Spy/CpxP family protein refolding chaperone